MDYISTDHERKKISNESLHFSIHHWKTVTVKRSRKQWFCIRAIVMKLLKKLSRKTFAKWLKFLLPHKDTRLGVESTNVNCENNTFVYLCLLCSPLLVSLLLCNYGLLTQATIALIKHTCFSVKLKGSRLAAFFMQIFRVHTVNSESRI